MNVFRRALALTGVLAVLAAGGCDATMGNKGTGLDLTAAVTTDEALHAALPPAIRDRGFIRLVTDASYAPMEYFAADGRTIIGFEPDLSAALGGVLGIRLEMVVGDFATALDEVNRGTYDGVFSSMTDSAERQKKADFVDYFSTGTSILVQRGNPAHIRNLTDLCGQRVAVEAGTFQEDMIARRQRRCGPDPILVTSLKTNADALLHLRTGRAVAVLNDFPPASYLVTDPRTNMYYQLASDMQYETGLFGIAVAKSSPGLRDALKGALDRLISTGTYGELLQRWGLASGAVTEATVNAGH
ncbi:ABC transporter substrate-binding protein [Actinoplanes oblitus]|uniref:ABC transporter substrate-binding protein n=1 Tax=Actinoplanes oblitus TaxID=3040509 RepID=A0ABY8WIM4_9ACTN|nr:ABC transporter substrate-binding protein [Actinoplanes oblitus]WIM96948.1 ABC transporter substrate-binding protein [Actinoplanes oblitus]